MNRLIKKIAKKAIAIKKNGKIALNQAEINDVIKLLADHIELVGEIGYSVENNEILGSGYKNNYGYVPLFPVIKRVRKGIDARNVLRKYWDSESIWRKKDDVEDMIMLSIEDGNFHKSLREIIAACDAIDDDIEVKGVYYNKPNNNWSVYISLYESEMCDDCYKIFL